MSSAGATAPLWRAAAAFRVAAFGYAVSQQILRVPTYHHQRLSWALIALMAGWTALSAAAMLRDKSFGGRLPRWQLVIADQALMVAFMWSTRLVTPYDVFHARQTLPTTLWVASAVVSAALLAGPAAGVASATLLTTTSALVRASISDLWTDPALPVLASVGLTVGVAARTAQRAQAQLEQAVQLRAATAERERLARQVHDGVLQVLAYVNRRGNEIGGATTELALLAGGQEYALRQLIAGQHNVDDGESTDLRTLLSNLSGAQVSVSMPGVPVPVPRATAHEIAAATTSALANAAAHAGEAAKAYVLLEDTGSELIVSIRDDGCGISAGRLAEAEAAGRMGVSHSIRGRITSLGGTATVHTAPGEGTEWEFTIPR